MFEVKRREKFTTKRGRSERQTCDLNGWTVGTVLRGHEQWGNGEGIWTTIRITAIGETNILARCISHERTYADGDTATIKDCRHGEGTWTLAYRDWQPTPARAELTGTQAGEVEAS